MHFFLKKLRAIIRWVLVAFFGSTILAVVALRFFPVSPERGSGQLCWLSFFSLMFSRALRTKAGYGTPMREVFSRMEMPSLAI